MIKKLLILLSLSIMIFVLGGCQSKEKEASTRGETVEVKDILGRKVSLNKPAEKIFLGFYLENYIAVSGDKKLDKVVSMPKGEIRDILNALWKEYASKIPKLETLTDTGSIYRGSFSMEKLMESKPDLVILAPFQYDGLGENVSKLEGMGIPVAVIDYNSLTLEKHVESTMILGKLVGNEKRAKELADNYKDKIEDVDKRVSKSKNQHKKVYFELASEGPKTYGNSYGNTLWGSVLERIKCDNIAKGKVEQYGPLSPEYLLSSNPETIFFSGQTSTEKSEGRFLIGFGISLEESKKSIMPYLERPGWSKLNAVKNKEVYGVDHGSLRTLYDYVYFQFLAKALHPEEFKDIDPIKNRKEFYDKYLFGESEGTLMMKAY